MRNACTFVAVFANVAWIREARFVMKRDIELLLAFARILMTYLLALKIIDQLHAIVP